MQAYVAELKPQLTPLDVIVDYCSESSESLWLENERCTFEP